MLHQREIESSADAAERAERHDAAGGFVRPPWLPTCQDLESHLSKMTADQRTNFFVMVVKESVRLRQLHELGLLEPILAERAEKRAAERATVK